MRGFYAEQASARASRSSRCLDGQLDDDLVADQVIGHAGVIDAEVLTIEGKLAVECRRLRRDGELGGKLDGLGHTVEGEVAGDGVSCVLGLGVAAAWADPGRFERGGRELGDVEE